MFHVFRTVPVADVDLFLTCSSDRVPEPSDARHGVLFALALADHVSMVRFPQFCSLMERGCFDASKIRHAAVHRQAIVVDLVGIFDFVSLASRFWTRVSRCFLSSSSGSDR